MILQDKRQIMYPNDIVTEYRTGERVEEDLEELEAKAEERADNEI